MKKKKWSLRSYRAASAVFTPSPVFLEIWRTFEISHTALGEVSSCAPLFSSTFVDVIHAESSLKVEQRRFKTHTRLSMETQWILILARSLSVGRSYQVVSPFYRFRLFHRRLLKSAAHLRVPRVFFFFIFFFHSAFVGPVRSDREGSAPTWLDLLTLSSALYPIFLSRSLRSSAIHRATQQNEWL